MDLTAWCTKRVNLDKLLRDKCLKTHRAPTESFRVEWSGLLLAREKEWVWA